MARSRSERELFPLLDEVFAKRITDEWCDLLGDAVGVRYAPVRDRAQVSVDPGVRENGYLATVDGAEGESTVVAPPVRFSATHAVPTSVVPELGQHTEEVLLEVGYTWEDIAALSEKSVI